ncbi:ABC transporter substrate-binding protein [Roseomonas sp. NAR14]|uniref:ABC transporter substrate-binding protein n=1 Tax=Roseomonas acroporae TaxID=2937791 RepID=A0A9X2BXV2_9PROT|nr:ABC transporter substrate-binding protein [Roseomonas acroporae]MCK8786329.1 ABC transporter substrate-binding protein [Roseomonas acroporae]
MTLLARRSLLAAAAAAPALLRLEEALAQGIAPRRGGTLQTMLTPEPPVLVLGVNNQGPTLIAASKIYQGLLKFSPTLEPLPELAKSWALSDDKRTYTFRLQENVTWHDGKPFTAEDVIFSVMKFHMELAPRARGIFSRIREAVAEDAHTVRFTLEKPFEPFLLMFDVTTVAIVPKHVYDGTDYRTNPANARPIGTGPFRFGEWQRGNFIRLERYEGYWKPGQPYLDAIIYRIVPDSQSRALALQTGQAILSQANDIEPFDVPRFRAQPNLEVQTKGWEYFSPLSWIETNHRVAPLGDVRVRQAIAHAINRDFIAQRLWFGVGKPATGPVASTTRFFDATAQMPKYDVRAATQLLDAAGLKPGAGGVRATIRHLVLPYGEVWSRLSEYLKQSLRQVGIDLVLESTDAGSWARRIAGWEYETSINFVYQYGDPSLGVERTYVSSNIQKVTFTNTGGYSNPRVDALFAEAREAADPADRQKAFSAVQKLLVEEVPQIWLMEMAFPTIHERKLHNVIQLGTGVHACFDDVFLAA